MSYDQYGVPRAPQAYNDPYTDNHEYNPYANQEPYPSYDRGGYNGNGAYRDDPGSDEPVHRTLSMATAPERQPSNGAKLTKERGQSYAERDMAFVPPVGSGGGRNMRHGSVRKWRRDYHGDLWTRGGTCSCLCRFFFCTIFSAVFLIISIVLSLALWARPPNINIGNVGLLQNGTTSAISVSTTGLDLRVGINITVDNPNYFNVDLKKIDAQIFYPLNGNKTPIGNGSESHVDFNAHTNKTFEFPFTIAYVMADDPNQAILKDLATKCLASPPQDLLVDYSITLTVLAAVIPINIPISNSASFPCPITEAELSSLLKAAGISSLDSLLGSL